ncbi:MAG: M20 family metallopeptidase [Candidatus Dormiibacterota bacterium]
MPPLDRSADLPSLPRWLGAGQPRWLEALEELVRCESPSGDRQAIANCARIVGRLFAAEVGMTDLQMVEEGGVPSLVLRWGDPMDSSPLLLCHLDTVWDSGSFQPLFQVSGSRAVGPGVFDMKGGVVVALAALAGLRQAGGALGGLTVLLTGDEEVGSPASRRLIEVEARRSSAVLVLEPPLGPAVKIARKGTGEYRLTVRGRAAHAGLDPERGVNSLVAIAPLVNQVVALARPELGTTVSPTVLRAGTRSNVIPAQAVLGVDVRFATAAEAERVEEGMRALRVNVPDSALELEGGANRPPFEPTSSSGLFALARGVAADLGWPELEGASVGGASDGNFTAALGTPTLDGLGIVGGSAHAEGEWAELDSIPERAALLAGLVARIWEGRLA